MRHNSTIIPKKKKLSCGCYDYPFSKGRCKTHATIEDTNKRIAKATQVEEDENFSELVADLDMWFSKFIRLYHADSEGYVRCFTSGVKLRWQDSQCGHFISRKHYATRWLPDNCRPQSEFENCHKHGNIEVFREKLDKEKAGTADWLLEVSREVTKPSRDELKMMIIEFRNKARLLEKKIKLSPNNEKK